MTRSSAIPSAGPSAIPLMESHVFVFTERQAPPTIGDMAFFLPLLRNDNGEIIRSEVSRSTFCVDIVSTFKGVGTTVSISPEAHHVLEQYRKGEIKEKDIPPSVMGLLLIPANIQWADKPPHLFMDDHIIRLTSYFNSERSESDYPYIIFTFKYGQHVRQFSCLKSEITEKMRLSGRTLTLEVQVQINLKANGHDSYIKRNGFDADTHPTGTSAGVQLLKDDELLIGGVSIYPTGSRKERLKELPNGDVVVTMMKEDGSLDKLKRYARMGSSWDYVPIMRTVGHPSGQEHDYFELPDCDVDFADVRDEFQKNAHLVNIREYNSVPEYLRAMLVATMMQRLAL